MATPAADNSRSGGRAADEVHAHPALLPDDVDPGRMLEQRRVVDDVTRHDDEIRLLARSQGADLVVDAQDPRVVPGGRTQCLERADDLAEQADLTPAAVLAWPEQIG